jgi:pimeloyl-ACP methyl ester carboxylesterase
MGMRDPDFPDPAAEARHVAERLGGEVLLVDDAGHYPHADDPEAVNPVLVSFLRSLSAGPTGQV